MENNLYAGKPKNMSLTDFLNTVESDKSEVKPKSESVVYIQGNSKENETMSQFGYMLLVGSVIGLFASLSMDVSVPVSDYRDVVNIQKLNMQQNLIIMLSAFFLASILLIVGSSISSKYKIVYEPQQTPTNSNNQINH